jgi:hypothetical protein
LVAGFRAGFRVFDGDFHNEFSATDILLGPSDLCSNVILGSISMSTPFATVALPYVGSYTTLTRTDASRLAVNPRPITLAMSRQTRR